MPFLCRPWILVVFALVVAIQVWAMVGNVIDQDWFLAVCFGVTSLAFVSLIGLLLRLRRQSVGSRWS
ncbi:hypothetical protein OWR29_25810 [Actinoplanes sp. Pm04-4]|uniref:Uncharacterized protein n=1 Tax=Paractinoplanes pyxinae TaxID=2997416 RepID=A0ABT4B4K1_9ACTN|nr:hypothetical protein [Actinoplanes pyxinae]MCY1141427.1 hypothetical protein [Actinoplanes pyxinae]